MIDYMTSRDKDYKKISLAIRKHIHTETEDAILAQGNSLEIIKLIPDNSVSLILTDPPYHVTKKKNIYGDTRFKKDAHYLEWIKSYSKEWRRILRQNGSFFLFCDSSMAARLEVLFSEDFNILSHIVWTKPNDPGFDGWKGKMKKESLRQWYPHSERIIFAEPAIEGNLHRSPFGEFLRDVRTKAGLSGHQLTESIGAYGKVNHGGAVSNWEAGRNTPSREQYQKICEAVISTGKIDVMPPYEDVIRVFQVDGTKEYTDVWTFPSVRPYKGKHPAEKPLDMLKHAIEATTYKRDIVLDCFAGSGNTSIAAKILARKSISIEIEEKWVNSISERLQAVATIGSQIPEDLIKAAVSNYQLTLF
ncbi:helix-turn-helix domain-containing protein [Phormidium pseudopriestleyi FRX01]|uniref:Methyltransferase n=1 Tax=Phormidium pseudopriestleyi FRX01 TaxID=1759528 RepID=A0ABS3FKQ8_9CYAN|nr:site-specific DNA-methyltransferase [Phormidium pseudopriestleyi]MBO0347691.1 helix-turn-helix domain-containing protein [Phormidium pseudopriestleyi FRX01]